MLTDKEITEIKERSERVTYFSLDGDDERRVNDQTAFLSQNLVMVISELQAARKELEDYRA